MCRLTAVLIGGPLGLPLTERVCSVRSSLQVVRRHHAGVYECFRFHGERMVFDSSVLIYEWSHRESTQPDV